MAAPSEPDFAAAEDASPGSEPDFGAAAATEKEPRLYVGNLNFRTEDQDLFEIFSEFGGVVDAHHVNDRFDPDRKRGFGFVTMETTAAAEAAVEALNGEEVGGRNIRVDFAAPQGERPPRTERPARKLRVDDTGRRAWATSTSAPPTTRSRSSPSSATSSTARTSRARGPLTEGGFGFITFAEKTSAEAAVDNLGLGWTAAPSASHRPAEVLSSRSRSLVARSEQEKSNRQHAVTHTQQYEEPRNVLRQPHHHHPTTTTKYDEKPKLFLQRSASLFLFSKTSSFTVVVLFGAGAA